MCENLFTADSTKSVLVMFWTICRHGLLLKPLGMEDSMLLKNYYFTILAVLLFGMTVSPKSAQGQDEAPSLGEEFIFFVNGPNILIPESDAEIVNDPLDPTSGNKVAKFNYGDWAEPAFRWSPGVGASASEMVSDTVGGGATLYLKVLVDPANAGKGWVGIMFTDKTDGSAASDGSADLPFRLRWEFPDEMRDGQWHDLAIPLPPSTSAALDSARAGEKVDGTPLDEPLDSLAAMWAYAGAWSNGGFGVWTSSEDLWEEFEWGNIKAFGLHFDHNAGGGPVYIDDMYIGTESTDISVAVEPAGPLSTAAFSPNGPTNLITWNSVDGAGGYNIYLSQDPINDTSSEGVFLIATADADATSFEHHFENPHPSLRPIQAYYAATTVSQFGVENPDISASSGLISNPELAPQAWIVQLSEDEAGTLYDNLVAGIVSPEGFPAGTRPFKINEERGFVPGDAGVPENDEDQSAQVWMGYSDLNELFVYAEITDDVVTFGEDPVAGGDTWQYDALEFAFGNYDVRDLDGGGIINGTPHLTFGRGDEPDYQFRLTGAVDAEGNIVSTNLHTATVPGTPDSLRNFDNIQGSGMAVDYMDDGAGKTGAVTGWKVLALIPLDGIQFEANNDVVLAPPAADELRLIPFTIALDDNDGSGREHQPIWTNKWNTTNAWWNTPAQWLTAAMAGSGVATSTEDEAEVPEGFALEQNYPNPFNPSTNIRFSLANTDKVTLAVYDVLGQRVATLVDDESMTAGQHTVSFDARDLASGVYLYRLKAGTQFVQSRQMLLVK